MATKVTINWPNSVTFSRSLSRWKSMNAARDEVLSPTGWRSCYHCSRLLRSMLPRENIRIFDKSRNNFTRPVIWLWNFWVDSRALCASLTSYSLILSCNSTHGWDRVLLPQPIPLATGVSQLQYSDHDENITMRSKIMLRSIAV